MFATEEIKNHIACLIKLAKADQHIAPAESVFIKSIAAKTGVAWFEFEEIIRNIDIIEITPPTNTEDRLAKFYEFVLLMNMDLSVKPEETAFLKELAKIYQLNEENVDKLISYMKENPSSSLSKSEFLEFVK